MHKTDENRKLDGFEKKLSMRKMHPMYSNQKTGMDCQVTIGNEDQSELLFRNSHLLGNGFTSWGKFTQTGLSRFLKEVTKNYEIKIAIFLVRRIR